VVARTTPIGGLAAAPGVGLVVEIVQIGEHASGEEGVPHEPYGSFHAAFFVAACHCHRAGFITIMSGKTEQCRMEADRITASFQDRTFEIIIE